MGRDNNPKLREHSSESMFRWISAFVSEHPEHFKQEFGCDNDCYQCPHVDICSVTPYVELWSYQIEEVCGGEVYGDAIKIDITIEAEVDVYRSGSKENGYDFGEMVSRLYHVFACFDLERFQLILKGIELD